MNTGQDYRIERLDFTDSRDLQRLVNLQNAVYEGKHVFNKDLFKYWYLDNPNGKVISFNAFAGDVIAAHYAIIPIKMNIDGRVADGALSMATVTHPEHRGKGLFKKLAQLTFECARKEGCEFVIGVANANSFPGFIKHLGFYEVGQLDVLLGMRDGIKPSSEKTYSVCWNKDSFLWRVNRLEDYKRRGDKVFGYYPIWKFKRCPFLHTLMGIVPQEYKDLLTINKSSKLCRPFSLYVGIGSNARDIGYYNVPKFIKHSPFHLVFLDMTDGALPKMTKYNIFFQLMDFDVA